MKSTFTRDTCDATGNDSTEAQPVQHWIYGYDFVLPSKSRDCVLGEILQNGVAKLPRMEAPSSTPRTWRPVPLSDDDLETYAEAEFGISVHIVRALSYPTDEQKEKLWNQAKKKIHVVDGVDMNYMYLGNIVSSEDVIKKPFEWIHRDTACMLKWMTPGADGDGDDIKKKLKNIFEEINGERRVVHTQPWAGIGWFEEITTLVHKMLERRNMTMKGKLRPEGGGFYHVVMKCEAKSESDEEMVGKGNPEMLFVKCTPPLTREVERTATIAGILGDTVPEIIGVNEQEGIMLQRSAGKPGNENEEWDQEALFDTILNMQVLSMSAISELEMGGLRVRDSEWAGSNVEAIFNHKLLAEYCNMSDKNKGLVEEIRSCIPEVQKKCRKITKLGLPRTIVHGDMRLENVGSQMISGRRVYRIFDWAKSFVGNPLHDFYWFLDEFGYVFSDGQLEWEQAFRYMCKQWKACAALTFEEMKTIFHVLSVIAGLAEIQAIVDQYDNCEDNDRNAKNRILDELEQLLTHANF